MYKENIKKIVLFSAIGFIAAFLIMMLIEPDWGIGSKFTMALLFSAVPYGWHLINKILGGWGVVGSIPIMVFFFILKLVGSVFLGWIATPVALVYNIIKLIVENKKDTENNNE